MSETTTSSIPCDTEVHVTTSASGASVRHTPMPSANQSRSGTTGSNISAPADM